MYRILKLNESAKLEEKDNIQDYKDFCKDMNINPTDQSSKDKYINLFSRMYAQYNGLSTLKAAKEKVKADLDTLKEEAKADRKFIEELIKSGALDDIDELKTTEEYEDAVNYWVDHYFDDYSDIEKEEAKKDGILKESKEYRYITTHGIGPGTLPNGVYIRCEDLDNGKTAIYTNRPLTAEELKKYDIKDEWIQESHKLTEAPIDDEIQDELEDQSEEKEKQEDIEDAEENQEETVDSEENQEENPVEEESLLDTQLDEIRDILIDLDDIRLYKIVSQDKDEFYILGKVSDNSDDVEMLVDTQPIDFEGKEETDEEITPEEIKQKFQFVTLPLQYDQIKDMNPKYGEDLETNHEEIMNYLMNLLIEQNPEAAEEHKTENKVNIEEPVDDYEEIPEEIISSKEDEDEEE